MLDGYGLHQLTWDTCDERFGDVLVASPADAQGRGISLAVRQNGAAANLTGAEIYLVWRHKVTGERGAGASGTTFTPSSPLSLSAGVLSIDLSGYATQSWVTQQIQAAIADLDDLSEVSF